LIVERNYGWELERLGLADGKPDLQSVCLGRDRIDLWRSAIAADMYALSEGDQLLALNRDGKRLWILPIPKPAGEPWRVQATTSALLLSPDRAIPAADLNWLTRRAFQEVAEFPTFGSFQRAGAMLYHGFSRRNFPVLAVRPRDGKKLQEALFPADGPRAGLILGDHAAVAVEGRMELLKSR
jgi:hypothetical protein